MRRIDLDNVSADVNISRNDTLDINGASHGVSDPYSGTLNLGEGSTFNRASPGKPIPGSSM